MHPSPPTSIPVSPFGASWRAIDIAMPTCPVRLSEMAAPAKNAPETWLTVWLTVSTDALTVFPKSPTDFLTRQAHSNITKV